MFELLLQADKALADGALDQAERTYWQLIELDPTNAIAVAGLARISLERGDERLARTLADRALGIDPDGLVARRVLEAISGGETGSSEPAPADLPLLAAQRLEALGRRRVVSGLDGDSAASAGGSRNRAGRLPEAGLSPVRTQAERTVPDEVAPPPARGVAGHGASSRG